MPEIFFHDLMIYRLTATEYHRELCKLTDAALSGQLTTPSAASEEWRRREFPGMLAYLERHLGDWRFNEVVGFLRLSILNRQVRGRYFKRRVRNTGPRYDKPISRETRTRTKVFLERPSLAATPEIIPAKAINARCLELINEYVAACSKENPRRYFDLHWLQEVGPYIDWQAMLEASEQPS